MAGRRRSPQTFAQILSEERARPIRPVRVPVGLVDAHWGDPSGVSYRLVDDYLGAEQVRALAAQGARVVFDACGCGGEQCALDWLTSEDVRGLVAGGTLPARDASGRAEMEHWRSDDGRDLVVLAVGVSWEKRIP